MPWMRSKARSLCTSRCIQKAEIRSVSWIRSVIRKMVRNMWVEQIALSDAIKKLPERESKIIKMRFYEGKTQMEAAKELSISQAQISRIEKSALKDNEKLSFKINQQTIGQRSICPINMLSSVFTAHNGCKTVARQTDPKHFRL